MCYLPSAQIMKVNVEFVIQEIGGDESDRWRCRRLFYVVPHKTPFLLFKNVNNVVA